MDLNVNSIIQLIVNFYLCKLKLLRIIIIIRSISKFWLFSNMYLSICNNF